MTVDPGLTLAAAVTCALYMTGARRARRGWPRARTAAFVGGSVAVWLSLAPAVDERAAELLSAHMVQHLVLTLLAAPLLAAGAPLTLALRTLPAGGRRALARLLERRWVRMLGHPATGLVAFAAVTVGTHLTPLYSLAVQQPALHALEHALYLGSALLFWAPVVAADRLPHSPSPLGRIALLLLAMPPMALVGAVLLSADSVRYDVYAGTGSSALDDQHLAGTIMWVGGKLALAGAVVAIGWHALTGEERRQRRREAHAVRANPGVEGAAR